MGGFVVCLSCKVWGDIPKGFKKTQHYAKCPFCSQGMYLTHEGKPEEFGLKQDAKVVIKALMNHEKRYEL